MTASTLPESNAGSRLKPTLTAWTSSSDSPCESRIVLRTASSNGSPATPTLAPLIVSGPVTFESASEIIEFSGTGIIDDTAITGMPCSAAK